MALTSVINPPNLSTFPEGDSVAEALAQKFRTIRLHALKTAPEAFGASYELEEKKDLRHFSDRLRHPSADYFWAIRGVVDAYTPLNHTKYFENVLSAEWVGFIGMLGPMDLPVEGVSAKSDPLAQTIVAQSATRTETRNAGPDHASGFHVVGTFVDSSVRRFGLGKALIEAVITKANDYAVRTRTDLHLSVLVDSENVGARKLYEKAGFRMTGEESYVQPARLQLGESQVSERRALRMGMIRLYAN